MLLQAAGDMKQVTNNEPRREYRFRLVDGIWRDVTGTGRVLADVLADYDLDIDYRVEYARIKDFERGLYYIFRVFGGHIDFQISTLQ